MDLELAGKGVIVLGGASNIGRSTTLEFAAEGANVVLADLDAEQAKRVTDEAASLAGTVVPYTADITSLESMQELVTFAAGEVGRIQVLANIVGWEQPEVFTQTTPELWEKIIAINLRGVFNAAYAVLPHLIENGGGSIVNVASDAGRIGEYKEAVYSACKAGAIVFTKSIAKENGPKGVRANVVCPGMTLPDDEEQFGKTSMHATVFKRGEDGFTDEVIERARKWYPLRKIGRPHEVARMIVVLSSDYASSHVTGQTVSVSGGYTML